MEEMMENPRDYEYYKPSHYDQHSHHPRMSGLGGAMGGFAAGMLGGLLIERSMICLKTRRLVKWRRY